MIIHSGEKSNNCIQSNLVRYFEDTFEDTQWRKIKMLLWCSCVNIHVLLQVPFLRKCFLAYTTFVLIQIFFMAFANTCVHIVLSVQSLCTYLTCEHTFAACMNLKMPCKVSFFEHISTFITFLLLMQLNVVMVHFGYGYKCFFTLSTDMLKHCPDLTKSGAELALDSPKSKSPPTI